LTNNDLWYPTVRIEKETVSIYEGRHKYVIMQHNYPNLYPVTSINVYDVDAENRVIDKKINQVPKDLQPAFSFDKKLFEFSKTTRDKILNRIKTILVFQ